MRTLVILPAKDAFNGFLSPHLLNNKIFIFALLTSLLIFICSHSLQVTGNTGTIGKVYCLSCRNSFSEKFQIEKLKDFFW